MALTVAELNTRLVADTKDFETGMKRAGDHTDGFGSKLKSGMGTMAKWGAAAAAAGAAAGLAFGVKAVMAASDLEESMSKVNVVFGKNAEEVQAWSKTTASSIGLSRTEALGAVGSFGNMFDQLGIGAKASQKMSTGMVELAADFASFHNADISEVIAAQSAAFRGEYDSLQRFLPLINAANVEQKALAMTGKKVTKELTAQEKALAVHALMLEGAGDAAGDFDRTSGGLANQLRILKAQATDFAANVGTVLIPFVLRGITLFKELSTTLQTALAPAIDFVKLAFGAFTSAVKEGDVTSDGFIGKVEMIGDTVHDFVEGFTAGVDQVQEWWSGFAASFRTDSEDTGTTIGKLMGIVDQLKTMFVSAFGAIQAIVVTVIDFVMGVWRVFGDDILSFTREFVAGFLETFRGALNVLTGIFDLIKAVLTGKWGEAWEAIKKIMDGAWDAIFGVIRNVVTNVIPTLFSGLGQVLLSIVRAALNGVIGLWNRFKIPAMHVGPVQVSPEVNFPDLPTFHRGGTVPGPRGADVPIMAQAGETITPAGGGGGSQQPILVQLMLDGRMVQEVLLAQQRRSGALGLT